MSKKRIIVLGAGLAGLSAAWHLQKKGKECIVFEKENEVGGLCRSKTINGFSFDYSGHLLHFKHKYTFNFVRGLLGDNLVQHKRNSWVYSHNRYIPYPFQANLNRLPSAVAKECLAGFIQAAKNNHGKGNGNFLSWINQTFGQGIARHFLVPYNTKFWTVSPQNLTSEWLDGFIPVPSLKQVIEGSRGLTQSQLGYNARFWYPRKGGINQFIAAIASEVKNIYSDCKAGKIDLNKKEITFTSGNKERFDYLISTIPLPELPNILNHKLPEFIRSSFKKLRWNSIFNLNLGVSKAKDLGQHWIYFPQRDICFFRIGFFHNFSPSSAPPGKAALYIEVSYSKHKPINKDTIISNIENDLKKLGMLKDKDKSIVSDINDITYGYPIYDKNYLTAREIILKYLRQHNLIPCGRYGSWRYLSMEDCCLQGRQLTQQIEL